MAATSTAILDDVIPYLVEHITSYRLEMKSFRNIITSQIGLSRLCLATFEQRLAFGATFCSSSNLRQFRPSE